MQTILSLTKLERRLWLGSCAIIVVSFLLVPQPDWLTLAASLIGVTSLIFTARGYVIGQLLMILFSALYGAISWQARYYGEMITYLGMTAPMALLAAIAWLRHPYRGTAEVAVAGLTPGRVAVTAAGTVLSTGLFYFILQALGTANLFWSTVSIATSFAAAALTFFRSPWYAAAYAANDVVLIILWLQAARQDPASLPVAVCFGLFLINDSYGFLQWRKMQQRQG